ncbi:hypothetical protein L6452_28027 [Arctium lappa]|uniref:Uncharacterized protein n=1 Tax=Arctium lappa TaxID=4217 RepID=A0ACB8ZY69_ARCLA|nr:hypothetical protein L6452_28027 [Arctium lappa]
MHVGALIMMYPSLIALVQVKFQSEKQSPFETHGSFMIMSVVALITAICTSGILFYIRDHSQSSMGKHFSLIHYMILKAVFCFSGILAPLSLVLTLFIPQNLNWIGYLIICTLFCSKTRASSPFRHCICRYHHHTRNPHLKQYKYTGLSFSIRIYQNPNAAKSEIS